MTKRFATHNKVFGILYRTNILANPAEIQTNKGLQKNRI